MAGIRKPLLAVLWASLGTCVFCLGCTFHVSWGRNDSEDAASAIRTPGRFIEAEPAKEPGAAGPEAQTPKGGIRQTGYIHHAGPADLGCADGSCEPLGGAGGPLPNEASMLMHPPYMIEPPDVLLIDAVRLVPLPPYTVQPFDQLLVRFAELPLDEENRPRFQLDGIYTVGPDGTINLGYTFGAVAVAGLDLTGVEQAIRQRLRANQLTRASVSVSMAQFRTVQQVRGEHLVRQDGTVSLGVYGNVPVAGLTLYQAKCVIEKYLARFFLNPRVAVDVLAYNSKAVYVIADGAGFGQQVVRLPITGKETVLDVISQVGGIPPVGSKKHIWVARPAPACHPCSQVLPVDWNAIAQGGATATNYQVFPGDRIYIKADPFLTTNNVLAKVLAPVQQIFGVVLLGSSTVRSFTDSGSGTGTSFIAAVP